MSKVRVAADFMRRKLVTLATDTRVLDAVESLLESHISGAPVVDAQGNYLGVFSEKCSLNALAVPLEAGGGELPRVWEFAIENLITLNPDQDVFESIDQLLRSRISGAPVVDVGGKYLGIFSEKTAMRVLIGAIYDQLPGTAVKAYMNLDRNRVIDREETLLDIAHRFQQTPYRRLIFLDNERLVGQVCRRDALDASYRFLQQKPRPNRSEAIVDAWNAAKAMKVGDYMDTFALTARSDADVLRIAQVFLRSPYRRLPIVENGKLVGQVSRRDVLQVASDILRPHPHRHSAAPLYLSSSHRNRPDSLG